MKRRTVITGIGVLCPLGVTTAEFWDNSLKGVSFVEKIPEVWTRYANYRSGIWSPLPDIDFSTRQISRIETMQNDAFTLLAIGAAVESLANAELSVSLKDKKRNTFTIDDIDSERIGVFMGTGVGGVNTLLSNHLHQALSRPKSELVTKLHDSRADEAVQTDIDRLISHFKHPDRFNPFVVSMLMPNAAGAALGIKFSCHGPNLTSATACAAGTAAIGGAFRAIQNGYADVALAGGSEYLSDPCGGIFQGFDIARTLVHGYEEPDAANRPFDKNHCGFLFSEGGACILVLENYEHARARKAPVIAEISGFSQTFDAHSMMSIAPDTVQIERVLKAAVEDAQLSPSDIDYLNAHGTGTEKNDTLECQAIERVFGDGILINSTKSLTGHLIGASGAVETAITALSIRDQTTHICRNLDEPIADLNFVRTVTEQRIDSAITQSFAFGGHNSALVLKRFDG